MKKNLLILGVFLQLLCGCNQEIINQKEEVLPPLFTERNFFLSAIKQNQPPVLTQSITGITVPHHLLAKDLIARVFALSAGNDYQQIIILSPDHYHQGTTLVSTTVANLETVFGQIKTDRPTITQLLHSELISTSRLFLREHGIQGILPFIKYYFPEAQIIPLAIRIQAKKADLEALEKLLLPLISDRTLIIQSTDFSHYLPLSIAKQRDQETLNLLATNDPEKIWQLNQPDHLDSLAAQYLQLKLQQDFFHATLNVVDNQNSQSWAAAHLASTTSYIPQIYAPEPLDHLTASGSNTYYFAGDTFLGRFVAAAFKNEEKKQQLLQKILAVTQDAPLIVNLEGVIMEHCPDVTANNTRQLCMEKAVTLSILQQLHVIAVSLANNHTLDFGRQAYAQMKKILTENQIRVLEDQTLTAFPEFQIFAITDLQNQPTPAVGLIYEVTLAKKLAGADTTKPLFTFIHWGREFTAQPEAREQQIANNLVGSGVNLIIGSHTHRASDLTCERNHCILYSLGNLLFDQWGIPPQILRVQFFPTGNYFLQLIPVQ